MRSLPRLLGALVALGLVLAPATPAAAATCIKPTFNVWSDTVPGGAGIITMLWDTQIPPPPLSQYIVERQNPDLSWTVVRPASYLKSYWSNELYDATYRVTTVGPCSPASAPAVLNP